MTAPVGPELDRLWSAHRAKTIATEAAVRRIQALIDVTDVGALDLLDSATRPSERYADKSEAWLSGGAP